MFASSSIPRTTSSKTGPSKGVAERGHQLRLDVDEIPAAVVVADALTDGASRIHEGVPGNSYGHLEIGDRDATDEVFAGAAGQVSIEVVNSRLAPTPMEPRN